MAWDILGSVGATTVGISAARNLFVDVPPSLSADRVEDARLIVTEIVAALARSNDDATTLEIMLRWDGVTLRVAVRQVGPPPFVGLHPAGQGGHTMLLLEALADRWGTDQETATIWAEVGEGSRPDQPGS